MVEHRDYLFEEWQELPFDAKRDLWNNYWDPYNPDIGRATREAITEAFIRQHPELAARAAKIDFGYFDKEGWCLCVVLTDRTIRVPQNFADVRIAKGVKRDGATEWLRR